MTTMPASTVRTRRRIGLIGETTLRIMEQTAGARFTPGHKGGRI